MSKTSYREQTPGSLPVVDVDAFGKHDSKRGNKPTQVVIDELPVSYVRLPLEDPSRVAVLSWRWDINPTSVASRNVLIALQQAKRLGFSHLIMDKVSIDQSLPDEELIKAVVNFSAFYKTIPVIAAYDEVKVESWIRTMRRPWISHEARLFRTNPTLITYVGYMPEQGTDEDFGFLHMLESVWDSTFTNSILMLLCNQIGMMTVSDLRFIMSEYAEILTTAYEMMPRNDYLLTAAILAQALVSDTRVNGDLDPLDLPYKRYTFVDTAGYSSWTTDTHVLLDGQRIATWVSTYNQHTYPAYYRKRLQVEQNAEQTIFDALGMPKEAYSRYVAREAQRRAVMNMIEGEDIPEPALEVVFADQD